MKHKHAEVIKAWADGAQIEWRCEQSGGEDTWIAVSSPKWREEIDYRVKPEKTYPQTNIGHGTLFAIYADCLREKRGYTVVGAESCGLVEVANAAIRHAIDSGQVVVPESAMSQQK